MIELVGSPDVVHLNGKSLNLSSLEGRRVLLAWPTRQQMQDVWGAHPAALAVIEWGEEQIAEWITHAKPLQLLPGRTVTPPDEIAPAAPLPNGIDKILSSVAAMAAGYSSGLKWDEEDKLKSDMMLRPDRWEPVTVEQVRAPCHGLGMRPKDVDTIAGFLQRRKDGHRFRVTAATAGSSLPAEHSTPDPRLHAQPRDLLGCNMFRR